MLLRRFAKAIIDEEGQIYAAEDADTGFLRRWLRSMVLMQLELLNS